jgi:hypothetical protein
MLQNQMHVFLGADPTDNNGGSKRDVSGGASSDNASGENASSDKASSEDPCHDKVIDSLASELGITTNHADDLLRFVRKFMAAEEFDKLVGEFCDQ